MGVLTSLFGSRAGPPAEETRADMNVVLTELGFGGRTKAGIPVTEHTAMNYSAVWSCVKVIAEDLAALPLDLFVQNEREKVKAVNHPLYSLLHDLPNPVQTTVEYREMQYQQALLWGIAIAEREYDKRGRLAGLWPLLSSRFEAVDRRPNGVYYGYRNPDGRLQWLHTDYLHIVRHMPLSMYWGTSPIQYAARQATGLGLAAEEFGSRFFANDARPGMVLIHPGRLSLEAMDKLRKSWASEHEGLSNAHRMRVLEEGMSVQAVGIPPEDAQFLETRKFQKTDIAGIFRVPPHMIADLERATFSNIEHQSINYVVHTLTPWIRRHETAIYRDLLEPGERGRYFAKYNVNGLLRGDIAARFDAYQKAIMTGFMSPNEARELEDWNPLDGLDAPWMPLNVVAVGGDVQDDNTSPPPLGDAGTAERAAAVPAEERRMEIRQDRVRIMNRYVRLFEDAAGRLVKREVADIRRAAPRYLGKRSVGEFETWLASFYEDLRGVVAGYFVALMLSMAEEMMAAVADEVGGDEPAVDAEWIDEYLANFATLYAAGGEKQLRTLVRDAEDDEAALDAVMERMDGWEENRASKTAMEQAFEAGNALALLGMVRLGVREKVWTGGDCPLCRKLNGVRMAIERPFLEEGDTLEADDEETAPFPAVRTIGHPPLHGGCDCVILAG